jgi:hypothetical protein
VPRTRCRGAFGECGDLSPLCGGDLSPSNARRSPLPSLGRWTRPAGRQVGQRKSGYKSPHSKRSATVVSISGIPGADGLRDVSQSGVFHRLRSGGAGRRTCRAQRSAEISGLNPTRPPRLPKSVLHQFRCLGWPLKTGVDTPPLFLVVSPSLFGENYVCRD